VHPAVIATASAAGLVALGLAVVVGFAGLFIT
jgi:hypothetical protein